MSRVLLCLICLLASARLAMAGFIPDFAPVWDRSGKNLTPNHTETQVGEATKETSVIKVGFNLPLSGDLGELGQSSKRSAEMLKDDINNAGGLKVGDRNYFVQFIYQDSKAKAELAVASAIQLIETGKVLGLVGPLSSKQAVPAGQVANDHQVVMIAPWSTNPATTMNRPWVFRAAFLDPVQGPAAVNFATNKLYAKNAAVFFDQGNDYSRSLAEIFRKDFERKRGPGAITAYQSHGSRDSDYSSQLSRIISSHPDLIFVPDNYNQVAEIVKQSHRLGYRGTFVGTDAWGSPSLMALCGDDCKGLYFSTHYVPVGAVGPTKQFIDRYLAKYGNTPNDAAALTWDAVRVLLKAIQDTGALTGVLSRDRKAVREAMASLSSFEGVTGNFTFDEHGDPIKCAMMARINRNGEFEFAGSACP